VCTYNNAMEVWEVGVTRDVLDAITPPTSGLIATYSDFSSVSDSTTTFDSCVEGRQRLTFVGLIHENHLGAWIQSTVYYAQKS